MMETMKQEPSDQLVVTSQQQREADRRAYATGLVPATLMESAGTNAAERIRKLIPVKRAVVLAGKGGNGGDALVVARRLFQHGVAVRAYALCEKAGLSAETAAMADRLEEEAPGTLHFITDDLHVLNEAFTWGDCAIDGLFGSGIDRPLSGRNAEVVRLLNAAGVQRVSLDLPSGLPSDRGGLLGEAVRADTTIAMAFLKPAHLLYPARSFCGSIEVVEVAYPPEVLTEISPYARVLQESGAKVLLPGRRPDGHKGTFGRVLVVAGSVGMSGAAILCARGALRAGAGLVTIACPRAINTSLEAALAEAITLPLPDEEGHLAEAALPLLEEAVARADVVVVGPGLSRHPTVGEIVVALLARIKVPVVVDADGLFPLQGRLDLLLSLADRVVLTPHPGELSRLIDRSADRIDEDRIEVSRAFACKYRVVLVLKGRPTAIGNPSGKVYLNPTGNTGLATGGSGDVLTGIIAGLLAGGASPTDAAVLGAYLHGYAADRLACDIAERAILPSDLVDILPTAIAEVERR